MEIVETTVLEIVSYSEFCLYIFCCCLFIGGSFSPILSLFCIFFFFKDLYVSFISLLILIDIANRTEQTALADFDPVACGCLTLVKTLVKN